MPVAQLFPARSKITWDNRTQTVKAWAKEAGMTVSTLQGRLVTCRTWDEAFSKPVRKSSAPIASKSKKDSTLGRKALRKAIILSEGGRCLDCGWSEEHSVLQHHHRDPKTKRDTVPSLCQKAVRKLASIESVLEECDKCDLLCPTCHAMRHFELRKKTDPDKPACSG